jgi:hypothetical protein
MVWDGTSLTRPNPSVYRAPDGADWGRLISELKKESFTIKSDDTIIVGNILRIIDSEIKLANHNYNDIVGIAITSTEGKVSGIVNRDNWYPIAGTATLTMGIDYFLINDGMFSMLPPATGWIHKVGFALSPNEFAFIKQTSVRL